MITFIITILLWLAIGIYSVGNLTAHFNLKFPTLGREKDKTYFLWALVGPMQLIGGWIFLCTVSKPEGWNLLSWNKWW